MNYTIEHIRAAFQAAKKGVLESDFIKYIEVHAHLHSDASPAEKVSRGANKASAPTSKRKRARKGSLGQSILTFLQSKGATGAHVKEIAAAVKTKTANVTTWLYSTGKAHLKAKTLTKVKPATFAYKPKDK